MCILCIQLYIYRMIFPDRSRRKNRQGEQGIIGVFVLCLMMLVMLMGTGLLYVIRQGAQEGEDYRREMELRLAAESLVEQEACRIEAQADLADGLTEKEPTPISEVCRPEWADCSLRLTLVRCSPYLYIVAYAYQDETSGWERYKFAKGVMKHEGNHYRWQGWAP